mmetsp:Transcript_64745/g.107587  ORF Transcript_64745/g.107587 Transcript_64745/m.107587 type:complete len:420 (-) Transcript_64745:417-1676(-)
MSQSSSPSSGSGMSFNHKEVGELVPAAGDIKEIVGLRWKDRSAAVNDQCLRSAFCSVLAESAVLPPSERLIMYDACEGEIKESLGSFNRKRLDPRRNTKPKKPDAQLLVCTPFDPDVFNFGKISNPGEKLLTLNLNSGVYQLLTNKFPLFPKHMLLVATEFVPQQLSLSHLIAISEFIRATAFCAYFNSWCASASVNHFHCHIIDERPPVTNLPLVPGAIVDGVRCLKPKGYPGFCYVFPSCDAARIHFLVVAMQEDNQPHNLLCTPQHIYLFPKPLTRPARSFELYPETVGGPELLGSFTVYRDEDFRRLKLEHILELIAINTAPLPARLLQESADLEKLALEEDTSPEGPAATEGEPVDDVSVPPCDLSLSSTSLVKSTPLFDPPPLPLSKSITPPAARRVATSAWNGRRRDAGAGI